MHVFHFCDFVHDFLRAYMRFSCSHMWFQCTHIWFAWDSHVHVLTSESHVHHICDNTTCVSRMILPDKTIFSNFTYELHVIHMRVPTFIFFLATNQLRFFLNFKRNHVNFWLTYLYCGYILWLLWLHNQNRFTNT